MTISPVFAAATVLIGLVFLLGVLVGYSLRPRVAKDRLEQQ